LAMALGPPIPKRSDSDECILKIKEWVQECEHTHESCNRDSFTPTRLLDVSSIESIRTGVDYIKLVECESHEIGESTKRLPETSRYIALSHCWGKSLHITTTK